MTRETVDSMIPARGPAHWKRNALAAAVAAALSGMAQGNPTAPVVVNGTANFAASGSTLTVTNSPGTIINWKGFSINTNETTRFVQQSAQSQVLNRVTGGDPSQILGTLSSNGRVFLINPNGIAFGAGAKVDVAGLVASSLNLSNEDFLAGRLNFTDTPGAGKVTNAGEIRTASGGSILLIAPTVENHGVLVAPDGSVTLAAGKTVLLVDPSAPDIQVELTAPANEALNVGSILANRVSLFGGIVNHSGSIEATRASIGADGTVTLKATDTTLVSGTITAPGGQIDVLGNKVGLLAGAILEASSASKGGTVHVGGGARGADPTIQNAQTTYMDAGAVIRADATDSGNGGGIVLWSEQLTGVYGQLSARGGPNGGDGGLIETSSRGLLNITLAPDASAPAGTAGTWLIDPLNITIVAGTGAIGISATNPFQPSAVNSQLGADLVSEALKTGTNVVIDTTTLSVDPPPDQVGDITVKTTINAANATRTSLTLKAHNNIDFQNASGIVATAAPLDVTLQADQDANGLGAIQLVGANIATNGGNLVMGGGLNPTTGFAHASGTILQGIRIVDSTISTGAGNITMHGTGDSTTPGADGVLIGVTFPNFSTKITTTTGNIAIVGSSDSNSKSTGNSGVNIWNGAQVGTDSGNISLQGTGPGTLAIPSASQTQGVVIASDLTGGFAASSVFSTSGNIDITGITGPTVSGQQSGVVIMMGSQVSTQNLGTITITGKAGDSLASATNTSGVSILDAGTNISTAGGTITIAGTGPGSLTSPSGGAATGVAVRFGATITSTSGDIAISGNGGVHQAGQVSNIFVSEGGTIQTGGSGNITLNGGYDGNNATMVGTGISPASGVELNAAILKIADGQIDILGGVPDGTSSVASGVLIHSRSDLKATGTGTIFVRGVSGNAAQSATLFSGVHISGSVLSTVSGILSITGIGPGSPSNLAGGSAAGVEITDSASLVSSSGSISISGSAGMHQAGNLSSVAVGSGSKIQTSGSGNIAIDGSGGMAGANLVDGVDLGVATIQVVDGAINIGGDAPAGSTGNAAGIYLHDGAIVQATGGGTISLIGSGANAALGAPDVAGVWITTNVNDPLSLQSQHLPARLSAASGASNPNVPAISIQGIAGGSSNSSVAGPRQTGVYLGDGSVIEVTGGAAGLPGNAIVNFNGPGNAIQIVGLSGYGGADSTTGKGNSHGVQIFNNGKIQSNAGNIVINGGALGARGTDNDSVSIEGGNVVSSSGTIAISGFGPSGPSADVGAGTLFPISDSSGVWIGNWAMADGAPAPVQATVTTSGSGNISILGTTGSLVGSGGAGVAISQGATVSALDGQIGITGTAITSDSALSTAQFHVGVAVTGGTVAINSGGTGSISVDGTGGNASSQNFGIAVLGGGQIAANNGTGTITLTGRSGSLLSSSTENAGVVIADAASKISTDAGFIDISGTGPGSLASPSGGGATGVSMRFGASITSNTGNIAVSGNGGFHQAGQVSNIFVAEGSTIQTGGLGNITLNGGYDGNGATMVGNGVNPASGVDLNGAVLKILDGQIAIFGGVPEGTGSNASGVLIRGGSNLSAAAAGSILIKGNSSLAAAAATLMSGVHISGSTLSTNSGNIDITGTGPGSATNLAGGQASGVELTDGASLISSTGSIFLTGSAGEHQGGNLSNVSVRTGSSILTSGSGNVSLIGLGGASGSTFVDGVDIGSAKIQVVDGAINITGNAPAGSTGNAAGIYLYNQVLAANGDPVGTTVQAIGSGTINLFGSSALVAPGAKDASGVWMDPGTLVQAHAGPVNSTAPVIQIIGTGGGTSLLQAGARQIGVMLDSSLVNAQGGVAIVGNSGYGLADPVSGVGDIHGIRLNASSVSAGTTATLSGTIQGSSGSGNSAVSIASALSADGTSINTSGVNSGGTATILGTIPAGSSDAGVDIVAGSFYLPAGGLVIDAHELNSSVSTAPILLSGLSNGSGHAFQTGLVTLNGTVINSGLFTVGFASTKVDFNVVGNLVNSSTGIVHVWGGDTLNILGGLNNSGSVQVSTLAGGTGDAILNVTGNTSNSGMFVLQNWAGSSGTAGFNKFTGPGTFTNLASGQLISQEDTTFLAGPAPANFFNAPLVNLGAVLVTQPLTMSVGTQTFGDFTNSGTLTVSNSLTLGNNLILTPTSVVNLSISGTGQVAGTDFSQISVLGNANLGGTLNLSHANGVSPTVNSRYSLITYGSFGSGADFAVKNFPAGFDYVSTILPTSYSINLTGLLGVNAWQGTTGNWNTAGSWSLGHIPLATEDVVIPDVGTPGVIDSTITANTAGLVAHSIHNAEILSIAGGSLTFTAASSSTGNVVISGGTLTANAPMTTSGFTLSGGVLGGTGALTVTGAGFWTGGTLAGGLTVGTGATLTMNGGNRTISTGRLTNDGNILWTTGSVDVTGNNTVVNNSLFDMQADALNWGDVTGLSGATTFTNTATGEIRRSVGTGIVSLGSNTTINTPNAVNLNNAGLVDVRTGTLGLNYVYAGSSFASSVTNSGTMQVANGATLQFSAGTNALAGTLTGAGNMVVSGGTLDVSGGYNIANTTINGGTANFNGTESTANLTLSGGVLGGTGALTVTGAGFWTGGTLAGGLTVGTGATLTMNGGNRTISTGRLTNDGNILWTTGSVDVTGNNTVVNNSLFDMQADALNWGDVTGLSGATTFTNTATGEIRRSVGTGIVSLGSNTTINTPNAVNLNNAGLVDVRTGTLGLNYVYAGSSFASSVTNSGTMQVANGATLQFSAGTNALAGTLTGAGNMVVSGGTLDVSGGYNIANTTINGGTANFNGTESTANLTLSGGVLGGTGALTVTGAGFWTGGTLAGGLTVGTGATLTMNGGNRTISTGRLTNDGNILWTTGSVDVTGNNTVVNNSLFDMQADALNWGDVTGLSGATTFTNTATGEIRRSVGTGIVSLGSNTTINTPNAVNLNNAGLVDVRTGTLGLNYVYAGSSFASSVTNSGTMQVANGATLQFSAGTNALAGTLTGAGNMVVSGGTLDVSGGYNIANTTINGGTANFNGTESTANLTLSGGVLGGTGALTVTGAGFWTGGTLAGGLTVGTGATLTMNGGNRTISTGRLTNDGNILWTTGSVDVTGNNTVVNNSLFDMQADALNWGDVTGLSGATTFTNTATGEIRRSVGTGIVSLGSNTTINTPNAVNLNNAGLVDVRTGTLGLNYVYAGSSFASSVTNSGTMQVTGAGAFLYVSNALINNGTIKLNATGVFNTLNVVGSYTQGPGGILDLQVIGRGPLLSANVLISGDVSLDGTLKLTAGPGYTAGLFESFQNIVKFGSNAGNTRFASLVPNGFSGVFTPTYTDTGTGAGLSLAFDGLTCAAGFVCWDNQTGNSLWSDPLNWTTNALPGSSDNVLIALGGTQNISLTSGANNITSLTGSNNLTIAGTASLNVSGNTLLTGNLSLLAGSLTAGGTFSAGTFTQSGGNATFNAAANLQNLILSAGTVGGSGTLSLAGLTWSGGTLGGSAGVTLTGTNNTATGALGLGGQLTNASGSNLSFTNATLSDLTGNASVFLFNDGIVSMTGSNIGAVPIYNRAAGTMTLNNSTTGVLNNSGVLNVTGTNNADLFAWYDGSLGGTGSLSTVQGVVGLGGGTSGTMTLNGATLNDLSRSGIALGGSNLGNGTLTIAAGRINTSSLTIGTGGRVNLNGGSVQVGSVGTNGANGTIDVAGGTLATNGGIIDAGSVNLSAGSLGGTAPLILAGTLNWTGGSLTGPAGVTLAGTNNTATGPISLDSQLTLNSGSDLTFNSASVAGSATFINNGIATFNGTNITAPVNNTSSGTLFLSASTMGALTNAGIVDLNGINNAGAFTWNSGTLTSANAGSLSATSLGLTAGAARMLSGAALIDSNGAGTTLAGGRLDINTRGQLNTLGNTLNINSGTSLSLSSADIVVGDGGGTITNAGHFTVDANSTLSVATVNNMATGTLDLAGTLLNAMTSAGTLNVTGTVNVTNFTWDGGTIQGTGSVDICCSSGGLVLTGTGARTLYGATLSDVNSVATTLAAGSLTVNAGRFDAENLTVSSGAGMTVNGGTVNVWQGDPLGTLTVQGTLNSIGGALNTATLNVDQGVLAANGGDGSINAATINLLNGGTLKGAGFVGLSSTATGALAVNNVSGVVSPGNSPGILMIEGSYSQGAAGTLLIEIAGVIPGAFDQLLVRDQATLGGILNVVTLGGFTPTSGQSFAIISCGVACSGGFLASPALPTGFTSRLSANSFALNYSANIVCIGGSICWDNQTGNSLWSDPLNWNTDALPISTDSVVLSSGSSAVNLTGNNYSIASIAGSNALSIFNGASLSVTGATNLSGALTVAGSLTLGGATTLNGGLTVNGGTVIANNTLTTSGLALSAGTVTLNGLSSLQALSMTGGTLHGTGDLSVTNSYSNSGGSLGSTFGSLSVTQATGNLNLNATVSTSGIVTLSAPTGAITNTGTVSGATLNLTAMSGIGDGSGGALAVDGATAGGLVSVSATNSTSGNVSLIAIGRMTVTSLNNAGTGGVSLTSNGDLTLASIASSSGASSSATSTAGNIFGNGTGPHITLTGTGVGTFSLNAANSIGSAAQALTVNPGNATVNLTATAGDIYFAQSAGQAVASHYGLSVPGVGRTVNFTGQGSGGILVDSNANWSTNLRDDIFLVRTTAPGANITFAPTVTPLNLAAAQTTFSPSGATIFASGTINIVGPFDSSAAPTNFTGAAVNFNGNTTLGAVNLSAGSLGAAGAVTMNGPLSWTAGALANLGGLTLNGASNTTNGTGLVMNGAVTLNGALTNAQGSDLTFNGATVNGSSALVNNGVATLNSTSFTAPVSNTSSGTLNLNTSTVSALTIAGNVNLTGNNNAGSFTWNGGTLTSANAGSLSATSVTMTAVAPRTLNGAILIDSNSAGTTLAGGSLDITGTGQLNVLGTALNINAGTSLGVSGAGNVIVGDGGGNITVNGALTSSGGTIDAGSINVDGGILTANAGDGSINAGFVTLSNGGTLKGSGTVGSVSGIVVVDNVSGVVSPGNSPGTLVIEGSYSQAPAGTLVMEIAGTAPGTFDQLIVRDQATLGGNLQVSVLPGYVPVVGQSFQVVDVIGTAGITGAFANTSVSQPGITFVNNYQPTFFNLDLTAFIPPTVPQALQVSAGAFLVALDMVAQPGEPGTSSNSDSANSKANDAASQDLAAQLLAALPGCIQ